jgi:hypothetical protein
VKSGMLRLNQMGHGEKISNEITHTHIKTGIMRALIIITKLNVKMMVAVEINNTVSSIYQT